MSGAAWFGVWTGLAYALLVQLGPQPYGVVVYFAATAALLTWGAFLCWRRMRLACSAAAMAISAIGSAIVAVLALAGTVFPWLTVSQWIVVGACTAAPWVLFAIESRLNREKWQRWKAHVEKASAWDAIRGRHIPSF